MSVETHTHVSTDARLPEFTEPQPRETCWCRDRDLPCFEHYQNDSETLPDFEDYLNQ